MFSKLIKVLPPIISVFRIVFIVLIILSLLAFFGQFFPQLVGPREVRALLGFGQRITYPLDNFIHATVPTFRGFDLINLIKIILFSCCLSVLDYYLSRVRTRLRYLEQRDHFDNTKT